MINLTTEQIKYLKKLLEKDRTSIEKNQYRNTYREMKLNESTEHELDKGLI